MDDHAWSDADLWTRQQACLDAGMTPVQVIVWTWCWARAGFQERLVCFTSEELGAGCRSQGRTALSNLTRLNEMFDVVTELHTKEGRGGYVELKVGDPLRVFSSAPRPKETPREHQPLLEGMQDDEPDAGGNSHICAQKPVSFRVYAPSAGDGNSHICAQEPASFGTEVGENSQLCAQKPASFGTEEGAPPAGNWNVSARKCASFEGRLFLHLREAFGAERFDLWFAAVAIEVEGVHVTCFAQNDFDAQTVRKYGREIRAAGLAFDAAFTFDVRVDPGGNSHICAQKPASFRTQLIKQEQSSSLGPFKGPKEERNQTNKEPPASPLAEGERLLAAARALFDRVASDELYPWVCILAELHALDGLLSRDEIDAAARATTGTPAFGSELRQLCDGRNPPLPWLKPKQLRAVLESRFGLKWQARWTQPRAKRQKRRG